MALNAGADVVGGIELIPQMESGEMESDVYITTPTMLKNIKHLSKVLKNKMPVERKGIFMYII